VCAPENEKRIVAIQQARPFRRSSSGSLAKFAAIRRGITGEANGLSVATGGAGGSGSVAGRWATAASVAHMLPEQATTASAEWWLSSHQGYSLPS
jgi:hypothetical protein